ASSGNVVIDSGSSLISLVDATTLSGNFTQTGSTNFTTGTGLTTIGGNLQVNGTGITLANNTNVTLGASTTALNIASNLVNLDTINNRVGIGTNAPTATLDVAGTASISSALTFRDGVGSIQTTANNTLTIGGSSTGNIILSPSNGSGTTTINGTTVLSGLNSVGIVHTSANGTLSTSLVSLTNDVTGILPTSNGGSPFDESNGAIFARNTTEDFLIGGQSTASAKFAVLNVNSGTPTASLSGGTFLTGAGNLGTTNNQSLTLGGADTGNIIISNATTLTGNFTQTGATSFITGTGTTTTGGNLQVNGDTTLGDAITDSITFTARVAQDADLIPITATGTNDLGTSLLPWDNLYVGSVTQNGATLDATYAPINANFVTITANGTLTGETGIDNLTTAISTTNNLNVDGSSTLGAVTLDANANLILSAGTGKLGIGTTSPLAAFDVRGNSGTTAVASISGQSSFAALVVDNSGSGDIFAASTGGVSKFTIQNNGTLVDSAYTTAGGIFYGNANGTFGLSAQGISGQVLQSNGAGAPTWVSTSAISYWDSLNSALSPKFATVQDLLLGSNATSSAKFAV